MQQSRRRPAPRPYPATPSPSPDPAEREAQEYALHEIERLNMLLAGKRVPPVSFIERPMLVTYIKAKRLGLLKDEA